MNRRHFLLSACAGTVTPLVDAQPAHFPSAPLTLVVPYAAGGSSDAIARTLAKGMAQRLGQQVIVENVPGAGGNIGAVAVSKAKPNGYTVLFAVSSLAANMALYKSPGYDLLKDFAPISVVTTVPNVLVVRADHPARSLNEFIAQGSRSTVPLNYGSAGNGTSSHLAAARFAKMAHLDMQHIPFKGGVLANQELLAGRLDLVFAPLAEIMPFLESGKLRALGVASKARADRLPQVPAIGELLPGYQSDLWHSLMAPAGTPAAVVATLSDAARQVLRDPAVRSSWLAIGIEPKGNTPSEFAAWLPAEVKAWSAAVRLADASID